VRFEAPLRVGRLLRRYKRFLVDAELADGSRITLHCPNTGAMTGCTTPGLELWYGTSSNPARKYPQTLEVVITPLGLVGVNTARANQLVAEALTEGRLESFARYDVVRREVVVPQGDARLDFCLETAAERCWIEVKSMTLADATGRGAFPDAVSTRALRHVETLSRLRRQGDRAVLLFCAQHTGIRWATTADDIQPAYGAVVRAAATEGVEVLAFGCRIDPEGISLDAPLPVRLT
jgi:sugar fermentation stimulation protein A